jgi:hypothetical protein
MPQTATTAVPEQLNPMLSTSFLALSTYAQEAIQRAIVPASPAKSSATSLNPADPLTHRHFRSDKSEESTSGWFEESPNVSDAEDSGERSRKRKSATIQELPLHLNPPAELDLLLPKVCETLVLITQCIVTIVLTEEERDELSCESLKVAFSQAVSEKGQGFIESLVGTCMEWSGLWRWLHSFLTSCRSPELLRLLDLFLPRINFGKPVGVLPLNTAEATPVQEDGFSYLKRDLVRLLGILGSRVQAVQDRVRECGGIPIIMNLCVIDERNPCGYSFCINFALAHGFGLGLSLFSLCVTDLPQHAIFTLHSLLEGNKENQAVVNAIGPNGGDDKLRDTPTEVIHK